MDDEPQILRPVPRRTFDITPASPQSSTPPVSVSESNSTTDNANTNLSSGSVLDTKPPVTPDGTTPSRTRSALNLTSSTLFGIFQPAGYSFDPVRDSEPATPWGTGTQTPARSPSLDDFRLPAPSASLSASTPGSPTSPLSTTRAQGLRQTAHSPRPQRRRRRHSAREQAILLLRLIALFTFGVAYGLIVSRLHENRAIAPVHVGGVDRESWQYLGLWGLAGIGLGNLLPWVDVWWDQRSRQKEGVSQSAHRSRKDQMDGSAGLRMKSREDRDIVELDSEGNDPDKGSREGISSLALAAEWNPVVRSVGAFVGIAFAIVRPLSKP